MELLAAGQRQRNESGKHPADEKASAAVRGLAGLPDAGQPGLAAQGEGEEEHERGENIEPGRLAMRQFSGDPSGNLSPQYGVAKFLAPQNCRRNDPQQGDRSPQCSCRNQAAPPGLAPGSLAALPWTQYGDRDDEQQDKGTFGQHAKPECQAAP